MKFRLAPRPKPTLSDVAGSSFGPTIKAQLDEERARKTSLEARGIGIVTSSGALATLLFGLVTFTRGNAPNQLHLDIGNTAKGALIAGVLLFAFGALMGLLVNLPVPYREALVPRLANRVTPEQWFKPEPLEAARRDAKLNVDILNSARKYNGWKAIAVFAGIAAEALAGVAVAVAVVAELNRLAG
jgi:hypothetical protein